jgi:dihydrofolate synthase/folylpolyglutamate synthase
MNTSKQAFVEAFLAEFEDLGQKDQTQMSTDDFSLEAMQSLMAALGNPEGEYASVHVAGSNGKGSVTALIASALEAQGYQVGTFTSPHLAGAMEGIRIDGERIGFDEAAQLLERMRPALKKLPDITHFEVVTALAFLYFGERKVDVAVVEVGLGGLLDATNVLMPTVSVITPIDLEHQSVLGNKLEEIAGHKAGIIKTNTPVVMALQDIEVRLVLRERAIKVGAKMFEVGRDVHVARRDFDRNLQHLELWSGTEEANTLKVAMKLRGQYQAENAATAYAALIVLDVLGTAVGDEAIRAGFARAEWPGRFEIVGKEPAIVLDAAHTAAASQSLAVGLDDYFPGKKVVALLGISGDKDLARLLEPLKGRLEFVVATESGQARAMAADAMAQELSSLGIDSVGVADPEEALRQAKERLGAEGLLLVFGSVFLVEKIGKLRHEE